MVLLTGPGLYTQTVGGCQRQIPVADGAWGKEGTFKPQSNGPLYSNKVICTLAIDGWAVKYGTARRGAGRAAVPPRLLLAVPNVTADQSTASVPSSSYSMWRYN